MRSVLEKQIVRRTKRLIRVRKVMCCLLPTGALDFPSRFRYIRHLILTPCT
jgi:hypothetical protein